MSIEQTLRDGEHMSVNRLRMMLDALVALHPTAGECELCIDGLPSSFHTVRLDSDEPIDPVTCTAYLVGSW